MKNKIYMAGPLFSQAEVNQRLLEDELINKVIDEDGLDFETFSPINAPINDKSKLPTSDDIFKGDEKELLESKVIFADLANEDAGVMMELGMVLRDSNVKIYAYQSDIRLATSGEYKMQYVPFGYNQFVIGGLEHYGHKVYFSFEDALEAYRKDFSK